MAKVLISYRREDSTAYAGRLYDHLCQHLGPDDVFMDIATIKPGQDFSNVIERSVNACDVVIALIGRRWLISSDKRGRRLDRPDDFVRKEIALALARAIPVIPVLVGGAAMPVSQDLPDDLVGLSRLQAVELSDTRFQQDVHQLVQALTTGAEAAAPLTVTIPRRVKKLFLRRRWLVAGTALLAIGIGLGYWQFLSSGPTVATTSTPQSVSPAMASASDVRPPSAARADPPSNKRSDGSVGSSDALRERSLKAPSGMRATSDPTDTSRATRRTPEEARTQLAQWALPYTAETFVARADMGDVAAVKLFLEAGMNPDVTARDVGSLLLYEEHTALMSAADQGNIEMVKALIAAGADVKKGSRRYTPLFLATRARHRAVVDLVLAKGVEVNDLDETFVPGAATRQFDLLRELVRRGANVEKASTNALNEILSSGVVNREGERDHQLVDALKVLLDMGADPNARDNGGWTPLMEAADGGHPASLRLLLMAGADVNARCACPNTGYGGSTPLMLAARKGYIECVEALLQRPHDLSLKDDEGRTALQRAETWGVREDSRRGARIVQLIKAAEAKQSIH